MFDVVALGELLIDFTPAGKSQNGNVMFERNPGGAPANVLAALSRLGKKTCFIGKVGEDQFGKFLFDTLKNIDIDTSGLVFSKETNTTLAFVHLAENGERTFSFYRNPGADMMLKSDEINVKLIKNTRIFHTGSISMTHEPARSATKDAVKIAKESGAIISYDPNLRPSLWESLDEAKHIMPSLLEYADVLKISEEELEFITGIKDLPEGTEYLYSKYGTDFIVVTMGEKGSFFRRGRDTGYVKGYSVNAVDTTGAGDAFLGGVLYKLIESGKKVRELMIDEIEDMMSFGNAMGALVTTKKGAIPAMPGLEDVKKLMEEKN